MTLWDLLTLLCFALPIGPALASAKIVHAGFRGQALAASVGVALGLGCAWTMRRTGEAVASKLKRRPDWQEGSPAFESYFRALYIGAVVWMLLVSGFAAWASLKLLRLAA
jgi:hypothetical protein